MKRALITGITGQDGSYLAEFLIGKGYEVHGVIRRSSSLNTDRIDHLYADPHEKGRKLVLHFGDMTDGASLRRIVAESEPHEVYNLAAQSHVRVSFDQPEYTADVVHLGTVRLLDAVRGTSVQVVESAVGAEATVGTLYECDQTGTISTMSRDWVEHGWFSKDHTWSKQSKVTVTTLDAARIVRGQPAFVKIDVEGYEPEVLRGLSAPVPLLSFEFHSVDMGKVRDCIARLTEMGMYHYNVALDEHPEMLFSDWVTALDVQERIKMHVSEHGPWWGDIYVAADPNVAEVF